jgi:hypothetical protein
MAKSPVGVVTWLVMYETHTIYLGNSGLISSITSALVDWKLLLFVCKPSGPWTLRTKDNLRGDLT